MKLLTNINVRILSHIFSYKRICHHPKHSQTCYNIEHDIKDPESKPLHAMLSVINSLPTWYLIHRSYTYNIHRSSITAEEFQRKRSGRRKKGSQIQSFKKCIIQVFVSAKVIIPNIPIQICASILK